MMNVSNVSLSTQLKGYIHILYENGQSAQYNVDVADLTLRQWPGCTCKM